MRTWTPLKSPRDWDGIGSDGGEYFVWTSPGHLSYKEGEFREAGRNTPFRFLGVLLLFHAATNLFLGICTFLTREKNHQNQNEESQTAPVLTPHHPGRSVHGG